MRCGFLRIIIIIIISQRCRYVHGGTSAVVHQKGTIARHGRRQ